MPSTVSNPQSSVPERQHVQDLVDIKVGKPSWQSLFNFTTRQHLPHMVGTFFFTILSSLLQPAGAIIYGKVFTILTLFGSGRLSPTATRDQIAALCVALVILGIISWVVEFWFMSMWMSFGELQAKSIREQLFASMLRKEMGWYDLRDDGIGSLLVRTETQIRELQLSVSQPFGFCMYEIGVSVVALGLGFYYSWKLTLVILTTLPVLAIVLFLVSRHLGPAIEIQKRELSLASKYATSATTNINTVKAYNGEDHEIWQYYITIKRVAASYMLQAKANALQFGFIKFATVGLLIQGFWFGLVLVNQGLDLGRVYTTYHACLIAMQSIEILLPQWLVLAKGKSAGHMLKSIMTDLRQEMESKPNAIRGSKIPNLCLGDIEIKNVSFSYPTNMGQTAMSGVNFFFPANETTYIIGRSGSGKSTVGNLLMRYYHVAQGQVLIDGRDIQSIDVDWLRENITLVQQQSVLFNETILQNIAFGRRGPVSREEIIEAAETADLQQTLDDLPEGLDTVVGSTGKSLSGGQQQRIALARARLRDSAIVILDEVTSALDQKSRAKVLERIREWRKGKTTIIITHDVSRILDEEYIYVLQNGVIIQEGYRKTLAEKPHGAFASFLPVNNAESPLALPRFSEPGTTSTPNPTSGFTRFYQLFTEAGFMSQMLGSQDSSKRNSAGQDGLGPLGAVPLGTGSVRNSVIQALDYLTTPEIPDTANYSVPHKFRRPYSLSPPSLNSISQDDIATTPCVSNTRAPCVSNTRAPCVSNTRDSQHLFSHGSSLLIPVQRSIYSPSRASKTLICRPEEQEIQPQVKLEWKEDIKLQPSPLSPIDTSFGTTSELSKECLGTLAEEKCEINKGTWPICPSIDTTVIPNLQAEWSPKSPEKWDRNARESTLTLESDRSQTQKSASMSQILRTIWPTLNMKDRLALVLGFLASFVVAVSTPAFAYVLAQLLNVYYLPTNRSAVAQKWASILIGIAIVDGLATFCSHLALEYAAQQWVNGLRVEALKRILAQPRSWFDKEKNSPDRLAECLDRNAEEMRNLLGRFVGPIFISGCMMSVTLVWSLIISYQLTLVAMSCFPLVYLTTRVYDWTTTTWEHRCNQAAGTASSILTEAISNIRVVRALNLEEHFKQKHDKAVDTAWKIGLRRSAYSGVMFGIIDSLSFFIVAIILRFGSAAITSGQLPILNLLQVVNLLLFGISNAVTLLNIMPQINSSRTTGTQMLYLAQLPQKSSLDTMGTKRVSNPCPIVFNNLSFTYPTRVKLKTLDGIKLHIEAGTCTAIVGPSGSGKSTIASLLLGIYPPDPTTSGASPLLSFAGVPVNELNLASLRNFISIVAQQPLLFPTTVYANITYGLPETSPYLNLSSTIRAAEDAGIHDFISSLPSGYQTIIGDGGTGLSGGQAQRIAIARALVRRPRVLMLDEATSALDKISADAIKNCISRIMEKTRLQDAEGERTAVVLITHDVEMMRVADRVVVVENGMVVEEGSFQELSREGEAFRELIGLQMREANKVEK